MYYVADGLRRAEHKAQGGKPKRLGYFERDMTVNAELQMPPQAVSKGVETLIDLKILKKIGPNRVVLLDRPELERLPHQSADSGEGGQCLRLKADSITVIADTCSRRRLHGSQVAIFSSSPELVL